MDSTSDVEGASSPAVTPPADGVTHAALWWGIASLASLVLAPALSEAAASIAPVSAALLLIAPVTAIVAIIYGGVGVSHANKRLGAGRRRAGCGLAMGISAALICIMVVLAVVELSLSKCVC
jgi:hypothetical protein